MNYWILSTPRTGGTYLSKLLNETGFFPNHPGQDRAFDEWLNLTYNFNCVDFVREPPKCLNLHYTHFLKTCSKANRELVKSVVPDSKFVWLRRSDVISQAVSFYIASHTKVWRIEEQQAQEDFLNIPVRIVDKYLWKSYLYVKTYENSWVGFEHCTDTIHLMYEDLRDHTFDALTKVLRSFGMYHPDLQSVIDRTNDKFKVMTRPESAAIKQRLMELLEAKKKPT